MMHQLTPGCQPPRHPTPRRRSRRWFGAGARRAPAETVASAIWLVVGRSISHTIRLNRRAAVGGSRSRLRASCPARAVAAPQPNLATAPAVDGWGRPADDEERRYLSKILSSQSQANPPIGLADLARKTRTPATSRRRRASNMVIKSMHPIGRSASIDTNAPFAHRPPAYVGSSRCRHGRRKFAESVDR
jgi:hypothetical protein